jgi:glycosyltransferase involved in cell wall biosynthesis
MFQMQTYDNRELLIYDDAGQYHEASGDRWRIVSSRERHASVGEKRNRAIELAGDTDAIATWDDDDVYLPWALESIANALGSGAWARPSVVFDETEPGRVILGKTFSRLDRTFYAYHGSFGFRMSAVDLVGKYLIDRPDDQDVEYLHRAWGVLGPSVDPICEDYPHPYYVYRRHAGCRYRISETAPGDLMLNVPPENVEKILLQPKFPSSYQLVWGSKPVVPRMW